VGDLERLKVMLWQRLLVAMTPRAMLEAADLAAELRHFTPQQVAEMLSLRAAYVHELCRSGRMPALKTGKYWMIPVAELGRWLAYQNRDVDGGLRTRLESPNPPGDTCRMAPAGQAGRARRAPVV
jgi:excisionase family DNA binding protein